MNSPQFTRFFSASLFRTASRMLILSFVGALLGINIFSWKQEYSYAAREQKRAQVLGAMAQQAQKESALKHWENISKQYPNYRDAFIMLGTLSYELGRFNEARTYLTAAASLDQYVEFPRVLLGQIR